MLHFLYFPLAINISHSITETLKNKTECILRAESIYQFLVDRQLHIEIVYLMFF